MSRIQGVVLVVLFAFMIISSIILSIPPSRDSIGLGTSDDAVFKTVSSRLNNLDTVADLLTGHKNDTTNPHHVNASQLGFEGVDLIVKSLRVLENVECSGYILAGADRNAKRDLSPGDITGVHIGTQLNDLDTVSTHLEEHSVDTGNPHGTTREQVQLGPEDSPTFANLTVTNTIIQNGETVSSTSNEHTSDTNNPHHVTREQVGLGVSASPTFAGATINGNIGCTGNVDGVDISSFYALFISHIQNNNAHGGDSDMAVGPTDVQSFEDIIVNGNITCTGTINDIDISVLNTSLSTLSDNFSKHSLDLSNPHEVTKEQLSLGTGNSPTFAGLTVNGSISCTGNVDGVDVSTLNTTVSGHMANTSNPHGVTKEQLSLGTTDSPVFAGLTVNGNITCTGTVDTIDTSELHDEFNAHVANTSNPHNVTKEQLSLAVSDSPTFAGLTINGNIVCTGNVDGVDVSTLNTTVSTINDTLSVHIANTSNPHSVSKEQVGLGASESPTFSNLNITGNITCAGEVDGIDLSAAYTVIVAHMASTSNPHNVTKDQLSLGTGNSPTFAGLTVNGSISCTGNVDGVDVSTLNSTVSLIDDTLDDHTADINNPHNVTKEQLGLGTTTSPTFAGLTINGSISCTGNVDGVDVSSLNTTVSSISSTLSDHTADTNNPHNVTKDQISLGTGNSPTFTGLTLTGTEHIDTIVEHTTDAGVTIEGVILKDNTITGTISTSAQTGITSLGTLTGLNVSGTTHLTGNLYIGSQSLYINDTQMNASAIELNYLYGTIKGTATERLAVVLDSNKDYSGINVLGAITVNATNLNATNIAGTLTTAAQGNVTSLGTLTGLTVNGNSTVSSGNNNFTIASHNGSYGLKLGSTLVTALASELNYLSTATKGTAVAGKALIASDSLTLSGLASVTATTFYGNLTGELITANQANITAVGPLSALTVTGTLTLGSDALTSTATELNRLHGVTIGVGSVGKALVLDDSGRIVSGVTSFSANSLVGTLTTAAQTGITSLGTLTSLSVSGDTSISGDLYIGSESLFINNTQMLASATELNYLHGATKGTAVAEKALITSSALNLSGLNILAATTVNATNLTGTLGTAAQAGITSLGTLTGLTVDGSATINSGHNNFTIASHDRSYGLILGSTLVTALASELNYLNGSSKGTAVAGRALIASDSLTLSGLSSITATTFNGTFNGNLTGTVLTVDQANITSLGTLTSLAVSGELTLGATVVTSTATEINLLHGITPGTGSVGKPLILDGDGKITSGVNTLTATYLVGTLTSAAQTNITSLGTLGSLTVSGTASVGSLTLGGSPVSSTAAELNRLYNVTPGAGSTGKSLVLDNDGKITSGIVSLAADSFIGTIGTATQTGITRVGTLTQLTVNGTTNFSGNVIGNVGEPVANTDAATKLYVDEHSAGLTVRTSCRVTTNGNLSSLYDNGTLGVGAFLTASQNGAMVVQGVTMVVGDRILVKDQEVQEHNGIYVVTQIGDPDNAWIITRATDADEPDELIAGTFVYVTEGNEDAGDGYVMTQTDTIVFGTTHITWTEFSKSSDVTAGTGLTKDGNVISINSAQPTITSLGTLTGLTVNGNFTLSDGTNDFNIASHDGTNGLKLGGALVQSSANELNYLYGVTAGTAGNNKALVLNGSGAISGITSLSASSLIGTLSTAAQPSITSLGTLTSLSVSGTLTLDSIAVTATSTELNYLHGSIPGTAASSKALVLDADGKITSGITSLAATALVGTLSTAAQTNVTSLGTLTGLTVNGNFTLSDGVHDFNIASHDGTNGLKLAGNLVQASADELNYLYGVTAGTAGNNKALVLDGSGTVSGITSLTAGTLVGSTLTGTLSTASQGNITSLGTLTGLTVNGNTSITGDNYFNIANHGAVYGLKLAGDHVDSTAAELNYLHGITTGIATAGKALVLDSGKAITGITALTSDTLYGTLGTAAQTSITSVGTLGTLTVSGNASIGSLTLGGTPISATADEINYLIVTPGTATAGKAIVLDDVKTITGITALTATTLTATTLNGTLNTAAQANITSLGTLTGLTVNGNFTLSDGENDLNIASHDGTNGLKLAGTLVQSSANELNYLNGVTAGTAIASKALVLDGGKSITGITSLTTTTLTATTLNGILGTAAQGNITSLGTLTGLTVNGNTSITGDNYFNIANHGDTYGLKLANVHVDSTAAELNYLHGITVGNALALKALVLDGSRTITGISSLTSDALYGTIETASQTNITSIGTLGTLTVSGNASIGSLTLGGDTVTSTAIKLNYTDVTAGTATASKALVLNASGEITGITALSATTLNGLLGTAAQGNITSLGTLTGLTVNGNFTLSDGTNDFDIASHDGTNGLKLGSTLVQSSANELNYLHGITAGTAIASKALVLDIGKAITGITTLTATTLYGTLGTAAQTGITSLGTLTSLTVSGNANVGSFTLGGTSVTATAGQLNYTAVTPGTATASKALVLDASGNIASVNSFSATTIMGTNSTTTNNTVPVHNQIITTGNTPLQLDSGYSYIYLTGAPGAGVTFTAYLPAFADGRSLFLRIYNSGFGTISVTTTTGSPVYIGYRGTLSNITVDAGITSGIYCYSSTTQWFVTSGSTTVIIDDTAITLAGSWASYGSGYSSPTVRRTGNIYAIKGMVKSGTTSTIGTLPVGMRPTTNMAYASIFLDNTTLKICRINVGSDGVITIASPTNINYGNLGYVSLDGLTF